MSFVTMLRKPDPANAVKQPRPGTVKVSRRGDALEREADQVADAVAHGRRVSGTALSNARPEELQRQDAGDLVKDERPKSEGDKYKEAGSKLADAFLKTDVGKKIKQAALETPLVKGATDFVSTLPGMIVAGTGAAGVVAALAATHSDLPAQIPEIPLDKIRPGLAVKLTYEGPVDHPTKAMVVFSYAPQPEKKKSGQTQTDKFRAETARIAADQDKFRAGMTYAPGSAEDLRQKAEQKAIDSYILRNSSLPGVGGRPLIPGLGKSFNPLDQIVGLKPAASVPSVGEQEKKEEPAPVQRKAANASAATFDAGRADPGPSSGQALDPHTRTFMEARFGVDFAKVRVHTGAHAESSARALNALAYTRGADVFFGAGQYAPRTAQGAKLLAHELAHTVQQSRSGASTSGEKRPQKQHGEVA